MIIRQLQKSDLLIRVQWMNDPRVFASMHYDLPILIEKTIEWFEKILKDNKRYDVSFVENGKIVAFGGLTSITDKSKIAELYIFVDPSRQHNGVGTQATSLLCEWGFSKLHLNKIYLITNEDNHSAIKVYQKCGFSLEGRHRQEYLDYDGVLKDRLYFGLLKTEWIENGRNK